MAVVEFDFMDPQLRQHRQHHREIRISRQNLFVLPGAEQHWPRHPPDRLRTAAHPTGAPLRLRPVVAPVHDRRVEPETAFDELNAVLQEFADHAQESRRKGREALPAVGAASLRSLRDIPDKAPCLHARTGSPIVGETRTARGLDMTVGIRTQDAELERLLGLRATHVDIGQRRGRSS